MNAQEVKSKISFYQDKYPDSKIVISGLLREDGKNGKLMFLDDRELQTNMLVWNFDCPIKQVIHSEDYIDSYDKTEQIIFLFTEEQDGIVKCDVCSGICGEGTVFGINKDDSGNYLCNDCYGNQEEYYCTNCKDSGCISCSPSTFF
jgi:hypothetical protein